jgi:hypothetical protein
MKGKLQHQKQQQSCVTLTGIEFQDMLLLMPNKKRYFTVNNFLTKKEAYTWPPLSY